MKHRKQLPRWVRDLLLIAIGISLLTFLYTMSTVDRGSHTRISELLILFKMQNARANEALIRVRAGLHDNNDSLVYQVTKVKEIAYELQEELAPYHHEIEGLEQLWSSVIAEIKERDEQIEAFKSHFSVLFNSVSFLPLAVEQFIQGNRSAAHPVSVNKELELERLLQMVLRFYLNSTQEIRDDLSAMIHKLYSESETMDPSLHEFLETILIHSQKVIEYKDEVEGRLASIEKLSSGKLFDAVATQYQNNYEALNARASRYQLLLFVSSAILLILVIYMLLRLASNSRELAKNISELNFHKYAMDQHAIISSTDVGGKITCVNDRFCEISGYTGDEMVGRNHRLIKSDEHPPEFFRDLWRTISSGKTWHGEIKNNKKNGGFYWVSATIVPFMNESGKPFRYISIRTDITHIKEMQARLQVAMETADTANKAKSEFLANMSHELRSPMTSIRSGLSTIKEVLVDPEADDEDKADMMQAIDFAQGSSERLLGLLNDILDLAKLEAGKMEFNIQPADLAEVIKLAIQEISPQAQAKSLSLKSDICVQDTIIPIDSGKIIQLVINLLNNAVKFTAEDREIIVSLMETNLPSGRRKTDVGDCPALKLIVSDQGVGIPEDELSHIFDKFAQSKKTKDGSGGTGLGLSIVQNIVLAHNGSIHVENNPQGGARFIVSLPR